MCTMEAKRYTKQALKMNSAKMKYNAMPSQKKDETHQRDYMHWNEYFHKKTLKKKIHLSDYCSPKLLQTPSNLSLILNLSVLFIRTPLPTQPHIHTSILQYQHVSPALSSIIRPLTIGKLRIFIKIQNPVGLELQIKSSCECTSDLNLFYFLINKITILYWVNISQNLVTKVSDISF